MLKDPQRRPKGAGAVRDALVGVRKQVRVEGLDRVIADEQ